MSALIGTAITAGAALAIATDSCTRDHAAAKVTRHGWSR